MKLTRCLAAVCLVLASALHALAQSSCSNTLTFNNGTQTSFVTCATLQQAPGVSVAWSLRNSTLQVAFKGTVAALTDSWLAWGINPTATNGIFMDGAGVIMATIGSDSSITVQTYDLLSGRLSTTPATGINVSDGYSAEFDTLGQSVTIYASVQVAGQSVFHGWNSGPLESGTPGQHPLTQQQSKGTLNLATGVSAEGGDIPNQRLKYNHGIVAVVGWGILIPLGIMVARYARPFEACDPAWYYTHMSIQLVGFTLGVIAWAMGMKLGNASSTVNDTHESIGITIFVFSILQVLALVLRPKKVHKVRPYWNIYHHSIGYVAALLAIVNIFMGFHILKEQGKPKTNYKNGYIAVLAVLAGIAFVLEVFTWIVYFRRRSQMTPQKIGGNQHHNGGYA